MTVADSLAPLDASKLVIKTTSSPSDPASMQVNDNTDHMLEVDWDCEHGWDVPALKPWAPIQIAPTASVLHYSTTCFEGMKAYKSEDGNKVLMFRPRANIERLNNSVERICLPKVDEEAALTLLERFLQLEHRFIKPGHFIYLRPVIMGTEPNLGFKTASKAKFMILATLMPAYYSQPLGLYCSPPDTIRAWPGGFGHAKLGANYAPTLQANSECIKAGYNAVLWLLGEQGIVTEAGTSNFFAVWKNEQGTVEVLTCPLSTGVILPGVTRRSVLELLQNKFTDAVVEEREFSIRDVEKASKEGRLIEAFSVGTAYFVAPVCKIRTPEGNDIEVPMDNGEYSSFAKKSLGDIMWGRVDHPWGHVVPVN